MRRPRKALNNLGLGTANARPTAARRTNLAVPPVKVKKAGRPQKSKLDPARALKLAVAQRRRMANRLAWKGAKAQSSSLLERVEPGADGINSPPCSAQCPVGWAT